MSPLTNLVLRIFGKINSRFTTISAKTDNRECVSEFKILGMIFDSVVRYEPSNKSGIQKFWQDQFSVYDN